MVILDVIWHYNDQITHLYVKLSVHYWLYFKNKKNVCVIHFSHKSIYILINLLATATEGREISPIPDLLTPAGLGLEPDILSGPNLESNIDHDDESQVLLLLCFSHV